MNQTLTLAEKLGTRPHDSALLRKAKSLGLDTAALERLAVERGCDYYEVRSTTPQHFVSAADFSNIELAIALVNPAMRYEPHSFRLGAAMLSAEGNSPREVAALAIAERCENVVRYVAEAGRKFEPQNSFWVELLGLLPS